MNNEFSNGAPATETQGDGSPPSHWPLVGLLYLTGLLAAAQLGKMSALAPVIGRELGLPLTTMATAISLIEIGGATLGAVAGLLAHRLGLRITLRAAVACLALAGLGGATAQAAPQLLAWRVLEAAGYLGVIVSAPVLIAHAARGISARAQAMALTLWSTFVPVGLALGAWANATGAAAWGWRATMAGGSLAGFALLLALWRARLPNVKHTPHAATTAPTRRLSPQLWCLVIAFGLYALFEVGVLGLLPTLLTQQAGLAAPAAGQWTALTAASAVIGSTVCAWLLRSGRALRWPIMLSLVAPALLLFGVFTPAPAPATAIALAIAVNVLGGIFGSVAFALLPLLAREPAQLVRGNSLVAQFGASGSLLGPPTMAACVQWGGWGAAAVLGLVVSLVAAPLAWRACAGPRLH